jgi:cold shock CspA family protein
MKGDWPCPYCGTENPSEATKCGTCQEDIEPDELIGATHARHVTMSRKDSGLWRVAGSGPGYVVVAARTGDLATGKGARILGRDAKEDQTVVVTEVSQRGALVYVRSALTPYPSNRRPWQAERDKRVARFMTLARELGADTRPAREPAEGRTYVGHVLTWVAESRNGTIACADRSIGTVTVRDSGVRPADVARLSAGQRVTFTLEKTPGGLVAKKVRLVGTRPG